jgi:purine-nucleoside phosphorylase
MKNDDAVIAPVAGKHPATIGRICVMASHPADLHLLIQKTGLSSRACRPLLNSRICYGPHDPPGFSLTGPFIGAPYAVMLLETVIAWGVSEIIVFGWCGAVSGKVRIGDLFLPTSAIIDEGTSRHYNGPEEGMTYPAPEMQARLKVGLTERRIAFREGSVWSTDAVFRETHESIARHRSMGAQVVEMECSALFAAAAFRSVSVGCVLAVSDDISSGRWLPGFHEKRFKTARHEAADAICDLLAASLSTGGSSRQMRGNSL